MPLRVSKSCKQDRPSSQHIRLIILRDAQPISDLPRQPLNRDALLLAHRRLLDHFFVFFPLLLQQIKPPPPPRTPPRRPPSSPSTSSPIHRLPPPAPLLAHPLAL